MNKILKTPLYNAVYNDYIRDNSKINKFIASPKEISWGEKAASLNPRAARYQQIKKILAKQNTDLQSDKAKIYSDNLEHPDSVILITGQQLGLFASPIYTLYKIISTIKLAESLNNENSKFRYVPVFWLETEDHDFQEINHFGLMNKNFEPGQLFYQGQDHGKVSLRHYHLDDSILSLISEIKESLIDTEFSQDLFDKINEHYRPNGDWTTAVREFLKELFYTHGLLFFQPGAEEIKKISTDFFTDLVLNGEEIKNVFDRQSSALKEQGYHNQVKSIPGQTFIHFEQENRQRGHLYKEGDEYYFKDSDQRFSQSEIIKLIESKPTIVSSTVISRPILQSWLLPVAAYIAGPGEIAYWAQLMHLFPIFELAQPVLYPRISATVIEPKISRFIEKYDVDINHLPQKRNEFIEKYFKNLSETQGDDPFRNLNNILEAEGQKLELYIKLLDPTLIDSGKKSMERIRQTLDNLENRLIKVKEQKEGKLTNHLQQIHIALFPQDNPQERFLSVVYFLNKFGPEFIDKLYSGLELENFDHQLLYL